MEHKKEKYSIAVFDNNEIEKLNQLKRRGIPIGCTLAQYDFILIPGWVWEEVCDSNYRKSFVTDLMSEGYPIRIVSEKNYSKIVGEELLLLQVFEKAIMPYAELKSYFRKHILGQKPLVDIDYLYEEWIEIIYMNWPLHGKEFLRSSGEKRIQKKNAGEISIAFLIFLLKFQKCAPVEVTVWTHDRDCRLCIETILEKLKLDTSFSYKNLDNILQECWKKEVINKDELECLVVALREERRITYLYKKEDNSNEFRTEIVDNNKYIEYLIEDKVEFVF